MKTVIHLETKRVYAIDKADSTPKIERTVVKLEDGDNFNKFVKNMYLKGYLKNDPPRVLKVLQKSKSTDDWDKAKEIDKTPWQNQVNEALRGSPATGEIDYKVLSEKQADRLSTLENQVMSLLEKENKKVDHPKDWKREKLEAKANALNITFRNNIGDKKLLEKIQAIEPDFKL